MSIFKVGCFHVLPHKDDLNKSDTLYKHELFQFYKVLFYSTLMVFGKVLLLGLSADKKLTLQTANDTAKSE
ncbi:hypothetical protein L2735_09940 [Shewanella olleyana]|uniref:hypothetical protein n=1 Tax=Shewanella olleyana TaxID=135626 RepID=UPI0020103173|nr:hypothetical protein [Shewanella olleyana]MCL1067127.1 hypothetical protein [Shewanella olleyana]